MASYTLEDGHILTDCCGSADCELCAGSGVARLERHDALAAGLSMLADTDVWPALVAVLTAQAQATKAELGHERRKLKRLARDVLATVDHLEKHWPGVGGLPSVQETKAKANAALGRVTIPPLIADSCQRVASEVR